MAEEHGIVGRTQNVMISNRPKKENEEPDTSYLIRRRLALARRKSRVKKTSAPAGGQDDGKAPDASEAPKQQHAPEQTPEAEKKTNTSRKKIKRRQKKQKLLAVSSGRKKGKKAADTDPADAPDWDGREAADDTEHTGVCAREKKTDAMGILKKAVSVVLANLLLLAQAILLALTNIVIVLIIIVVVLVVAVVAAIRCATYGFLVDEKAHIRSLVSNVTYELSADIDAQRRDNDCNSVITVGSLADWREVIALWWTIRENKSDTQQWDGYFEGDDQRDIAYIFYQFNKIDYRAEELDGGNRLRVIIKKTGLNELVEHWMLDAGQRQYLQEILENEELWKELLGATELSRIAFAEIGQTEDKYLSWYGAEAGNSSAVFVSWCMERAGLLIPGFLSGTGDVAGLQDELTELGFYRSKTSYLPEEGDIVFMSIAGESRAGILTRIENGSIYVTLLAYVGRDDVTEITMNGTSGMITGYGHIEGFGVPGMSSGTGSKIDEVLAMAASYVGTVSVNNNVIFNTDYYGHEVSGDAYAWCCTFVWDIFRMADAGYAFYYGAGTAACPQVSFWATAKDLFININEGQPGDLILFDFNANGYADHIGIIYSVNEDGSYNTIEGNTGAGSDANGGEVMMRIRPVSLVFQIVRPEY